MRLKDYTDTHTQISLAKLIGIAPSFVNQWVNGTRPIPITACVSIEQVTNGAVTRQELRPNDFWLIWPDLAHVDHTQDDIADLSEPTIQATEKAAQPTDIDLDKSDQERRENERRERERREAERRAGARRAEEVAAAGNGA